MPLGTSGARSEGLSPDVLSSRGVAFSSRNACGHQFGNCFRECAQFNWFPDMYVETRFQSANAVRFVSLSRQRRVDFVIERDVQAPAQILRRDVVLVPMGAALEIPFAPAGEVQHRLAQRLRPDCSGVHTNAADAPPALHHQYAFLEFRRLTAARRPAGPDPMTMRSKCCDMRRLA
jgi:hypothetical protein